MDASSNLRDEREHIRRGRAAEVDDKIGMPVRDLGAADPQALQPGVLDDLPGGAGQFVDRRIVREDGTAVRQVERKFSPPFSKDAEHLLADIVPVGRDKFHAGFEDDPAVPRIPRAELEERAPVGEGAFLAPEGS